MLYIISTLLFIICLNDTFFVKKTKDLYINILFCILVHKI